MDPTRRPDCGNGWVWAAAGAGGGVGREWDAREGLGWRLGKGRVNGWDGDEGGEKGPSWVGAGRMEWDSAHM